MRFLGSITNRIFLASALLGILSIGAAVYFVSAQLTSQTEAELQRDLTEAATLVREQIHTQFDNVARTARLIADLPKFKAALDTADLPTLIPIAADYREQAGADLLMVTGRHGEQLAVIGEMGTRPTAPTSEDLALEPKATPAFWLHPAGVLEVVSVPVPLGPEFLGVLSIGTLLDDRRAAQFKALSGADIAFAMGGAVRSSTLGATLLAIVVSYGVARTITRPLASITDHMRQIAVTGDLTKKIPTRDHGGWDDDDAHMLASTFNSLTDSVVRFQRDAAQRERLSSLGRLSTVIAHEVRNPLMIIKGALRTLGRDGASAADVRDAAKDIDEEIERLNSLVTDVLDVARPIRFDATPTDINAVCRAAVQAASAGPMHGPMTLDLGPALPELNTDGERLRTVLVNLLANAQDAVEGRPNPRVMVITQLLGERRVAIVVRDNGKGISEDDLARIFDPYFTTRRAGTGLGLAIAKNIIEAMGGTIGVTSRQGAGTDFRIELSDAPIRIEG
jgi:signal transduction histidine kinase